MCYSGQYQWLFLDPAPTAVSGATMRSTCFSCYRLDEILHNVVRLSESTVAFVTLYKDFASKAAKPGKFNSTYITFVMVRSPIGRSKKLLDENSGCYVTYDAASYSVLDISDEYLQPLLRVGITQCWTHEWSFGMI